MSNPELREPGEIGSLHELEKMHGHVPWNEPNGAVAWLEKLDTGIINGICYLLTGDVHAKLTSEILRRLDVKLFLAYLYMNAKLGREAFRKNCWEAWQQFMGKSKAPFTGLAPVVVGIERENVDEGHRGKHLAKKTAEDTAKFIVGLRYEGDGTPACASEFGRKSFWKVLEHVKALEKMARRGGFSHHDIEHAMEHAYPDELMRAKRLAQILAYFRYETGRARAESSTSGIQKSDIKAAEEFLHTIQEILAELLAKLLAQHGEGPAWQHASELIPEVFFIPYAKAATHPFKTLNELETTQKTEHEEEGEEGEKDKKGVDTVMSKARKALEIGHEVASVAHAVGDVIAGMGKRLKK